MGRNLLVLVLSCVAVFGLFWGYVSFVKMPDPVKSTGDDRNALPSPSKAGEGEVVRIQTGPGGTLPPGGSTGFTMYDPKTGRATDHFRCKEWRKVPNSLNQVEVVEPFLSIQMPSGIVANISASRGTITTDRIEGSRFQPKQGFLIGDVRIVLDRGGGPDEPPSDERPDDLITITTNRVDFDMDLGEMRTEEKLSVGSTDMEVVGRGFHMIWNQADNRLESLTIAHGDSLAMRVSSDLFGSIADEDVSAETKPGRKTAEKTTSTKPGRSGTTQPTSAPTDTSPSRQRRSNSYDCLVSENVRVSHFRGDKLLGGLDADELRLLFDLGGNAGQLFGARRTTSRPTDKTDRLEVHWSGPLTLGPAPTPATAVRRRHVEASGREVLVRLPQGDVRCSKLVYHDETQQLWLYPLPGAGLDLKLSDRLAVRAASLFVDRKSDLVKLIGPVEMRSMPRPGGTATRPSQGAVSIKSDLWAELHLEPDKKGATTQSTELFATGALKSAVFAGDVVVQMGARRLFASRLDATFKPVTREKGGEKKANRPDDDPDLRLDTVVASGEVRMAAGTQSLTCSEMKVWFGLDKKGDPTPRIAHAEGQVELRDRERDVSASGQRIEASFDDNQQIREAVVMGTFAHSAKVYARPYTVRGPRIEVNPVTQTLHVAGRSRLTFLSARGLRGETYARPTPIVITCTDDMSADGRTNLIEFVGDVNARSGSERLLSDSLTMTLEDVAPAATQPSARKKMGEWWTQTRTLVMGRKPAGPASNAFISDDLTADRGRRKEPLLVVARNVTVLSEERDAEGNPMLHQSVTAPEMQIQIRERRIRTVGRTVLGMENLTIDEAERARGADLGLPSALMSRGPSQTALECEKSMIYVIGADGPQRRDTVLFDGGVKMVQVAGKEVLDLDRILPKLSANPDLLTKMKSRNTVMTCDQLEAEFAAGSPKPDRPPEKTGGLTLRWLNALGNVNFRDQQGPKLRTVTAHQTQFDRDANVVRVLGTARSDVRIYDENVDTGQLSTPAVGPEFTIFLDNNTVKTGRVGGEFRRPRD